MTLLSSIGRAPTYTTVGHGDIAMIMYEDEDELMLNSAQYARSAASRPDDDVIILDRSALDQAREGLGGRDMGLGHSCLVQHRPIRFFSSHCGLGDAHGTPVIKFNA